MLPDVPGTWNRAAYKDKLSALKKYMHLTPNSDAIPDCALHNRSGIMRQEGQAGCGEIVFKSVHCTSLVFVTFGWLFIAGSLYKSTITLWSGVQANISELCQAPTLPSASQRQTIRSWEWHIQDVAPDPPLTYTRCEHCVWESVSHRIVGSCIVSDYIK